MAVLHRQKRDGSDVVTALRLMRLALPLLDKACQGLAAARLQHAIDALQGVCLDALDDEHRPDVPAIS